MLERRGLPFEVPSYSLTGDILSFQRCGLQYRYYNGSSLPPSRPVQMWVGEFVHGVLEEAFRYWQQHNPAFPWPCNPTPLPPDAPPVARNDHDIGVIGERVEARLAAAGKRPRNREARDTAYSRVAASINLLAPHLFPLITAAEERISGTRPMPGGNVGRRSRGDRYELTGVVDVISSVIVAANAENPIVGLINEAVQIGAPQYDVIVDYKALRRPGQQSRYWAHHQWQVQTYAWLRSQIPQAIPVGAGMLIYVNELAPSQTDSEKLQEEFNQGTADVVPAIGSQDYYALQRWQRGQPPPQFTPALTLRRAIRVVGVSFPQIGRALGEIDQVVGEIEGAAVQEFDSGNILGCWHAGGEESDCVACDFHHFCPAPAQLRAQLQQPNPPARTPPVAPG